MANTRRNSHDTGKIAAATATTALSNTSPLTQSPAKGTAYPILDNPIFVHVNEQNNNTIIGSNNALATAPVKPGMLHGLPEMFTDIDLTNNNHHINGSFIDDNLYKSYVLDNENEKQFSKQASSHGSLSSITTTSIASSDDPKGGRDSGNFDEKGGGFDRKPSKNIQPPIKQEEWWKTTLQVSIPFLIAGLGTIGAGLILGRVERWKVFTHISELFILVPALLGLKGNLDMCLASRLSTQANLGRMTCRSDIIHMIVGNIALVQVQAIVASFIVAVFAMSVGGIMNGTFEWSHCVLLVASSMFTATSSCFVLDFVLVAVILLSHRFRLNPDNCATPLAASIGDVVSLSVLSFIASTLFDHLVSHFWVPYLLIVIYLMLLPVWITVVLYNSYTCKVLKTGWTPVLTALFISGMGGLVLDAAVDVFKGFVVFQPIINGIGGNLVSVQSSRISTMLHQSSIIGIVPPHSKICEPPWRALIKGVPYAKSALILILMSIPGQIMFIFVADYIHMSKSTIGAVFVCSYLFVSLLQICTLLYIAHVMIHVMWKYKIDPDNSAIPILTALGDLFGSCLLALAFAFMISIGKPYIPDVDVIFQAGNGTTLGE